MITVEQALTIDRPRNEGLRFVAHFEHCPRWETAVVEPRRVPTLGRQPARCDGNRKRVFEDTNTS